MNHFSRIITTFAFCMSALSALAQESGSNLSIGSASIEGLRTSSHFTFDQDFAQQYGVAVPAPFSINVPTGPDHEIFVGPAPGGTGIVKAFFLTPDKQVRSNIQFFPMTIKIAAPEQRLEWARQMLQDFFNVHVPEGARNQVDWVRIIENGPYPAIELVGRYENEDSSINIVRVVAIPKPESEDGIIAVIIGAAQVLGITDVAEIYRTLASETLDSFHFQ